MERSATAKFLGVSVDVLLYRKHVHFRKKMLPVPHIRKKIQYVPRKYSAIKDSTGIRFRAAVKFDRSSRHWWDSLIVPKPICEIDDDICYNRFILLLLAVILVVKY